MNIKIVIGPVFNENLRGAIDASKRYIAKLEAKLTGGSRGPALARRNKELKAALGASRRA